jgi:hypothetical protein
MYAELVAFTGPYDTLFANDNEKVAHWNRLVAICQTEPNVILELVNELDQPANANIPMARLQRPTGCTASHGSNGSEAQPVSPVWDYVTFHTNGAFEWERKVGHNCWEIWAGPCLANENTRAPDNYNNPARGFDASAGAALLAAGSAFHSVAGKNSTIWFDAELANAKGWSDGAHKPPLKCQAGDYKHRDDLEGSQYLRVYQRGNDNECIVPIGKY